MEIINEDSCVESFFSWGNLLKNIKHNTNFYTRNFCALQRGVQINIRTIERISYN